LISVFVSAEDFLEIVGEGGTALMWAAARSRNPEIITILLSAGANPKLKSNSGMMAIEYAEENPLLRGTKRYKALNQKSL
jgi:ankyrin repeat protein